MTEPIEPIGDTSTWRLCPWCRHIGTHDPEDHPLPPSHPDYDAYYDAPDGVLAEMVADAIQHFGRDHTEDGRD